MASEKTFKPGDVVRLKSGGPNMTVSFEEDDSVACQWFSGAKLDKLEHARFAPATLEPAPTSPGPRTLVRG